MKRVDLKENVQERKTKEQQMRLLIRRSNAQVTEHLSHSAKRGHTNKG